MKHDPINPAVSSAAALVQAADMATSPDAMGLERFTQCARSLARSTMSLNMYTALETRQNKTAADSAQKNIPGESRCCLSPRAKKKAARTTRFFVH